MSRYEEILDHLGFLLTERDIIVQDLTPEQVLGLEEIHRKYPVIDKKNLPQLLKILQIILKLRINIDKLETNCIKTLERRELLKTQLKTETPIINTPNVTNTPNTPNTPSTESAPGATSTTTEPRVTPVTPVTPVTSSASSTADPELRVTSEVTSSASEVTSSASEVTPEASQAISPNQDPTGTEKP